MESVVAQLIKLADKYGPALAALLFIVAVTAALVFLYLVLVAGDKAGKMFVPFAKSVINTLVSERDNDHPAIRLEYGMHRVLILFFFGSLGFLMLHALIPWHVRVNEGLLEALVVSIFVVFVILCGISFRYASRLS